MLLSNYQLLNIKNIEDLLVENSAETYYKSEDENPPCHREARQIKDLQQTLNS